MNREKVVNAILKTIKSESDNGSVYHKESLNLETVAKAIEVSVYNYTIQYTNGGPDTSAFGSSYTRRAVLIVSNLKQKNNKDLLDLILNKKIQCKDLEKMKFFQLNLETEKRRNQILKLNRTETDPEKMPDGLFQCGKCKKKKTRFTSTNQRSADEPPVIRVICYNCDHRWKFS